MRGISEALALDKSYGSYRVMYIFLGKYVVSVEDDRLSLLEIATLILYY